MRRRRPSRMRLSPRRRTARSVRTPLVVRIEARDLALGPILRGSIQVKDSGLDGHGDRPRRVPDSRLPASAARGTLTMDPVDSPSSARRWTNRGPYHCDGADGLQVERTDPGQPSREDCKPRPAGSHGPLGFQVDGQSPRRGRSRRSARDPKPGDPDRHGAGDRNRRPRPASRRGDVGTGPSIARAARDAPGGSRGGFVLSPEASG